MSTVEKDDVPAVCVTNDTEVVLTNYRRPKSKLTWFFFNYLLFVFETFNRGLKFSFNFRKYPRNSSKSSIREIGNY